MGILANSSAISAPAGVAGFYDHQIENSFRWDSGYLKRTPSSAGNRQTWTFSCWMKQSGTILNSSGDMAILNAGSSGHHGTRFRMYFHTQQLRSSSNEANYNVSASLYRDPSAWMHIVWKLTGGVSYQYVNGVLVTSTSVSGDVAINNNVEHTMGVYAGYETASRFKGYLAEVVFIDGTALDPTSFASEKNGCWIPDEIDLTFGSQGYHLDFANASAPGNDVSGNNNDWTNVSLATHDQMLDSPTFGSEGSANFATINPLDPTIPLDAISEGNLQIAEVANNRGAKANFALPLTGKWYWEQYVYADSAQELWGGITGITTNSSGDGRGGSSNSNTYGASWSNYSGSNMFIRKFIAGSESAESGSFGTTKDTILGIAINRDDNEAKFYKNNALQFTTAISATQEYFPAGGLGGGTNATTINIFNFGQSSAFSGNETSQGNADGNGYGDFYYAPPSGFLALNSANLPTAASIDPAETDDNFPKELFFMSEYTGNLSGRTVTTENQADLIWNRQANNGQDWYVLDSTRGITANKYLYTNTSDEEKTLPQSNFTSLGATSVGISAGTWLNSTGSNYKLWMWRANGGTTSSGSGNLTSTHQVDPSGGFSIVKAQGDGGSGDKTITHGLSTKPKVILAKNLTSAYHWEVFFDEGVTAGSGLRLNTDSAEISGRWGTVNDTIMTAKATYSWNSTDHYIYYCFANIEGYIKASTYVGNAATDGTYVQTGFSPSFVLNKPIVAGNWRLVDSQRSPTNVTQNALSPNNANAKDTGASVNIDLLSNGFKMRNSQTPMNQATTYVYLAFSEEPFKYATGK